MNNYTPTYNMGKLVSNFLKCVINFLSFVCFLMNESK